MPAGLSQIDPVELLAQLVDHALDAFVGQRVLVAGLRGRQQIERLEPLVADQRLRQLGVALHDVDQVVDDAALGAHHEIEVAQADVEVDDDDALARLGERRAERRRRRRLADAALAGRDDQNLAHVASLLQFAGQSSSRRM